MRHWKLEPLSLELKVKVGVALVLPAWSVAGTSKVWLPSLRAGERVSGLVQEDQPPLSMRHWKLEPLSLELKVLSLHDALPILAGLESIVVSGAVRSTVQV